MNCPGCAAAMSEVTLQDRSGAEYGVDVCNTCLAFWFDRNENSRLSPASTITLFNLIAEQTTGKPFRQPLACPRCSRPLALAHDMQARGTRFEYWRCLQHGHFITFLQFLKEKDFVRPLTPKQVAELRQNVQVINCSNCGGPIDLVRQSVCPHCASPLTMIDMKQIAAHVRELQQDAAEAPARPKSGTTRVVTWTMRSGGRTETFKSTTTSSADDPDVDKLFAEAVAAMTAQSGSKSLVHSGLSVFVRWLGRKV